MILIHDLQKQVLILLTDEEEEEEEEEEYDNKVVLGANTMNVIENFENGWMEGEKNKWQRC